MGIKGEILQYLERLGMVRPFAFKILLSPEQAMLDCNSLGKKLNDIHLTNIQELCPLLTGVDFTDCIHVGLNTFNVIANYHRLTTFSVNR